MMDTAYVAIWPGCGHVVAASVINAKDKPADKRAQAKTVAEWVTSGYRVETMGIEAVREGKWCPSFCPERGAKARASRAER